MNLYEVPATSHLREGLSDRIGQLFYGTPATFRLCKHCHQPPRHHVEVQTTYLKCFFGPTNWREAYWRECLG